VSTWSSAKARRVYAALIRMTPRPSILLVIVLAACVFANSPVAFQDQQASTLDRVLPAIEAKCEPGPECLWRIAERDHIPLGVEFERDSTPGDRLPFSGPALSVKTFLDRFVETHPSYEWRQMDRGVVVRPRAAWRGQESVLNRPVQAFHVADVTLPEFFQLLDTPDRIRHFSSEMLIPGDERRRRVTLDFDGGSLLDAINTVARAYDYNVAWKVEYRRVDSRPSATPHLEPQLTLDCFLPRK
jgi:hypothetical protein